VRSSERCRLAVHLRARDAGKTRQQYAMALAAECIIADSAFSVERRSKIFRPLPAIRPQAYEFTFRIRLMSRMKGIVEIDAGQDRKHVGL